MVNKFRTWLQDLSAVCGVAGVGALTLLKLVPPFVLGFAVGIGICYPVIHRLLRLSQKASGYRRVALVCHNALRHVKQEIWIFAGDLSWIDRDREFLHQAAKRGVRVLVLAERPKTELSVQNFETAKGVVTEVRYYPKGVGSLKALVIEPQDYRAGGIILIEKRLKPSADNLAADDAGNPDAMALYRATFHSCLQEPLLFDCFKSLFDAYWRWHEGERNS